MILPHISWSLPTHDTLTCLLHWSIKNEKTKKFLTHWPSKWQCFDRRRTQSLWATSLNLIPSTNCISQPLIPSLRVGVLQFKCSWCCRETIGKDPPDEFMAYRSHGWESRIMLVGWVVRTKKKNQQTPCHALSKLAAYIRKSIQHPLWRNPLWKILHDAWPPWETARFFYWFGWLRANWGGLHLLRAQI